MTRTRAAHPRSTTTTALLALLVAALIAPLLIAAPVGAAATPAPAPAATTPFDDVAPGAFYHDAVAWLADADITTGTGPATFSPGDAVTRGQMATFLLRYAQVTDIDADHGFGDVPAGAFYDDAVSFLVEREITTGTSPSTYSPNDAVTRAQMATFLWRFSFEPTPAGASGFTDVPTGAFYTTAVAWLAESGITTGTSPTTYSPDDVVTRGQMATFLWRLAGEPVPGELGSNRVDLEQTTVLDESDLGAATEIDVEGESTLDLSAVAAEDLPGPGEVVVMGITDETPEGFIGMVEEVDGSQVTTSPATLQDAIPEADFASTFDFDELAPEPSGAGGSLAPAAVRDRFKGVEAACTSGATLRADIDFGLDAGIDVEASWDPLGDGVEAYVGFHATATATVELIAEGAVECEAVASVDGPKLKAITFWLGPVPVVLVPEISFEAVLAGSFEASASATAGYEQTVGAGLRFQNGRWSTEYTNDRTLTPPSIDFETQLTASLDLRARLDLKVYGAAGPYLTVGPFLEFTGQNAIPWWTLDAGVRASIGASIDVFFFKDEIEFAEIELARFRLADSGQSAPPGGIQWLPGAALFTADASGANGCGIGAAGSAWCWGDDFSGQLGRGSSSTPGDIAAPVANINTDLFSPDDDALKVVAGGLTSCALIADGTVSCWGDNTWGSLGNGTTQSSDTAVPVPGITDAIDIATRNGTTCAILADHTLQCWGRNGNGQVGDGTTTDQLSPVTVPGLDIVVDVTVGGNFTCALRATGDIWCWGHGYYGELGNGETGVDAAMTTTPVPVSVIDDAVEIDAGSGHTCARRSDDHVWCWGSGGSYQLGNVSTSSSAVPVAVQNLGPVVEVTAGGQHSCALRADGTAKCWGGDHSGQIGNGLDGHINLDQPWPVTVERLDNIVSIDAGQAHTCAATANAKVYCWGDNEYGQIGDGDAPRDLDAPLEPVQD